MPHSKFLSDVDPNYANFCLIIIKKKTTDAWTA